MPTFVEHADQGTATPTFIPGIGTVATPSTTTRESSTGSQTKTSFSAIPTTCGQVGPFQIGVSEFGSSK